MDQSTTRESISSSRVKFSDGLKLLPPTKTTNQQQQQQKLISLSKLKDLMHKCRGANLDEQNFSTESIGGCSHDSLALTRAQQRRAACDISQQQQAAIEPQPSNQCVTDQNYNNYNLVTSSPKSSSPNSISLNQSPKAHAMQTLAVGHHGSNQMIPSGLNHSAQSAMLSASEHHLDHSSHHYIDAANAVSELPHHQINQQHYAYSQHAPSTGSTNHHPHQLTAASHEQSSYSQLQHQQQQNHQQQQQQQQQLQQQHQHQQQQQHQHQHQQHQQAQQQSISEQQFIYHQIANSAAVGTNHGYAANVANNAHYYSQLQSNNNQANNLMSEVHQNHLSTAATAAAHAAAAVVSQTLKTVAHQHNHHQHQHYGNSIATGFNNGVGLMNMTAQHHPQFHSVSSLAQHHPTHHLGHNHASVMGIQPGQQQQQSHLQQAPSLPEHQSSHSIVTRKYQCRMCPQVFMSKAEMKYHNQNHLREAKPYKCLQCPKAFANSSYLSQHMRIHQGLKPYACDICSRKFTQLSHLQQHKRTHTGDKPYKCNYMNCTKQFSQLSNLQSHSRCHQLDKPYKCNSCYKCFHDEQSLLEHIPRHLESKHLKRNLCIFCGSSYQQERGLVKHFQQYHTDKSPTLVTAAIAAGTTGNTGLIASLVSSTQAKFATPSSGSSTTSSISSNSSCSSSTISNHCQATGQNGNTSGNTNMAHTNSSGVYQIGGFH